MIGLNNKKIGFITDTSSTIGFNQYDDVKVLPLGVTVTTNGEAKTYKDGIDFSIDQLKDWINDKDTVIKTSQANMMDMYKACDEMCAKYDYVIVMPIHNGLSGNVNTWRLLKDDYPNLIVLMTCDISTSFNWTYEAIKQYLITNDCIEQSLQSWVDTNIVANRFGFLMVEDLKQLAKGGRVSNAKAFLAKLFKIYPVILYDGNGLTNFDKAKGNDDLFEIFDNYIKEHFNGKKVNKVFISLPIGFEDVAKKFEEDFNKHYAGITPDKTIFTTVVVCHTGLKYVAIYADMR